LTGYTWNITYGDKSGASGTVGTDVVTVGGTSVTGQAVEIANHVSPEFVSDTASNGLLGFAFNNINTGEIQGPLPFIRRVNKFP
jgi:aspergillopepsin I